MSLTLRNAITATQTTIDVNGLDSIVDGAVFKVDDEYLLILGTPTPDARRTYQRINVARGNGGSAKAAHLVGAALTAANAFSGGGGGGLDVTDGTTTVAGATTLSLPAGTVTDEGAGVAGVAAQLRILGPFRVNFDDPGIGVDGVVLAELVPGEIVIRAWAEFVSGWNDIDGFFGVTLGNDPAVDFVALVAYHTGGGILGSEMPAYLGATYPNAVENLGKVARVSSYLFLGVVYYPGDPAATAGISDVYALIAEPAA